MTTKKLTEQFLIWFQKNNQDGRIYRNNTGMMQKGKRFVKFGIPLTGGGSDFIAFLPVFRVDESGFVHKILISQFYELKLKKDKMSKKQIDFANLITGMGGDYFIVKEKNDSFDVVKWEVEK
jgi:hypothetical protein